MVDAMKTYILCVSAMTGDVGRYDRLNFWLQNSVLVAGYWNYIPYVYGIKCYISATDLTQNLKPVLGPGFIVAEINAYNLDGQLQQEAWPWFYTPPVPRTAGLAGMVGQSAPNALSQLGRMYDQGDQK